MKASIFAVAIVAALSVPIASAQDRLAPAKPAMNMDTGKQTAETQANMEKMQQQMDKIATTTDPKERQKLMQEHMQTMQDNMKTMRGMSGMGGMGGPKMKGGMMMGDKKESMANGDLQKRQERTESRMDMMQMMMEQMMQRDKASKPMGDK